MVITDKAEKKLSEILTKAENKGKALKLYIAGFGWGGPRLGIALEEQKKGEHSRKVNGIKIVWNNTVGSLADNVTIDYRKTFFNEGFTVNTGTLC